MTHRAIFVHDCLYNSMTHWHIWCEYQITWPCQQKLLMSISFTGDSDETLAHIGNLSSQGLILDLHNHQDSNIIITPDSKDFWRALPITPDTDYFTCRSLFRFYQTPCLAWKGLWQACKAYDFSGSQGIHLLAQSLYVVMLWGEHFCQSKSSEVQTTGSTLRKYLWYVISDIWYHTKLNTQLKVRQKLSAANSIILDVYDGTRHKVSFWGGRLLILFVPQVWEWSHQELCAEVTLGRLWRKRVWAEAC